MSRSDDTDARRSNSNDRSPPPGRRGAEGDAERTWSKQFNQEAQPARGPSNQRQPGSVYDSRPGYAEKKETPATAERSQSSYSRHGYDSYNEPPRPPQPSAWDNEPPRFNEPPRQRDFAAERRQPQSFHDQQRPVNSAYHDHAPAHEAEFPPYPHGGAGYDNPYGSSGVHPSQMPGGLGYEADSLYDRHVQPDEPASAQVHDHRQGGRERAYQPPVQQRGEPVDFRHDGREADVYEQSLGARISQETTAPRFFLPQEQTAPAAHGAPYGQQLYDEEHVEPQQPPEPVFPYDERAFDEPLDQDDAWRDDHDNGHDDYRANLPSTRSASGDELDADFFSDEDGEFEHEDHYPAPRKGRKKLLAAVLAGAVAVGGGGAYFYKTVAGGDISASVSDPLVKADDGAAKETPAEPGGREFANGEKTIYDRLTPDGAQPQPADGGETQTASLAETASDASPAPQAGGGGTLEDRIEEALKSAKRADGTVPEAPPVRSGPDQPIVVRSEVYRPDGTRVDNLNGGAQPPPRNLVDTANLPPPFGSGPARITAPASRDAPASQPAPRPDNPVVTATATPLRAAEPEQTAPSANALREAPAEAPRRAEPEPPAPVKTAALSDGYYVQMKATNDEKRAQAEISQLNDKYGSVLSGLPVNSKAVDLGDKGVWFRLMAGPLPSKEDASALCEKLKGAGLAGCILRSQ